MKTNYSRCADGSLVVLHLGVLPNSPAQITRLLILHFPPHGEGHHCLKLTATDKDQFSKGPSAVMRQKY